MATKKAAAPVAEETKPAKKAAPKKEAAKFQKATEKDFSVVLAPIITEKTMSLMQEQNKVTVKVAPNAKRSEVKLAFERIFQVKVDDVRIANVRSTLTTRGTRFHGVLSGYKKAIVTVANGEAIDLFKD